MVRLRPTLRRARLVVLVLLLLSAVAATVAWRFRDEPRRRVEQILARRLEADVSLAGLRVLGPREVLLTGLEIGPTPLQPLVARITIRRLVARGGLREAMAGRFEALEIDGLDVLLEPAEGPVPASEAAPSVEFGRLAVEDLVVRLADAGVLSGSLVARRDRAGLTGHGRLRGESLRLAPLAVLGGAAPPAGFDLRIDRPDVTFEIGAAASALHLDARGGLLIGERAGLALPALALDVRRPVAADEPVLVSVTLARGEALGPGELVMEWNRAASSPASLDGRLERIDAARLAAIVPDFGGRVVEGTLSLEISTTDGRYRVAAAADALRAGTAEGIACRLAELRAGVETPAPRPAEPVPLEATLSGRVLACDGVPEPWDGADTFPMPFSLQFRGSTDPGRPAAVRIALEPARSGRFEVSGTLVPSGKGDADLAWRWSAPGWSRLVEIARLAGVLSGDLHVTGPPPDLSGRIAGRPDAARLTVDLTGGPVRGERAGLGSLTLDALAASARLTVGTQGVGLASLDLQGAGTLELPAAGPALSGPATFRLAAGARRAASAGDAFAVEADLVALDELVSGRFTGSWRGGLRTAGRLDLELPDLSALARAVVPDLPDTAASLRGSLAAALDLDVGADGAVGLEGTLELPALEMSSADGARVVQGLATRGTLSVSRAPAGPVRARVEAELGGAVVLWDSLFADLSEAVSSLRVDAHLEPDAGAWSADVRWALAEGPKLAARLAADAEGGIAWSADVAAVDLARTWARYLVPVIESAWPEMAEEATVEGRVAARLAGRFGAAEQTVRGAVSLAGGRFLLARPGLDLTDLAVELPVDLTWRDGRLVEPDRLTAGSLALGSGSIAGLPISTVDTPLEAGGDRILLGRPVTFRLLGGAVRLERMMVDGLLTGDPRLTAAAALDRLDLSRLPTEMLPFPVEGTIAARFPAVRVTATRFEADGGGEIDVFGGTIRLGDLSGRDLFSPYPRLSFSAEFEHIDLGRLTRRLGFGEITGHVDGEVVRCELVGGLPVRLEAEVRSSPMRRDRRSVTVRAVRNLTILGSGGNATMLDRGITRFFDRYTYSRLGIAMSLEDDMFLLRGLERRGRRELFIKGRLPLPIDVVNAQPGRRVAFRSMLERLRALDLESASTSPR